MRTLLKVKSEIKGTLKQENLMKFTTAFRRLAAGILLTILSLGGMAFSESDTTKNAEDTGISRYTTEVIDSCCTKTYVHAMQNIVIVNTSYFDGKITINNMDLKSWTNSLMAYSFKRINVKSVEVADVRMDVNFSANEKRNRNMAVAFGKNITTNAMDADEKITDLFMTTVAAPLFEQGLNGELQIADEGMDQIMKDELELKAKIAAFRNALSSEVINADENMDVTIVVVQMKTISPVTARDADLLIDSQLMNQLFKQVKPSAAKDADQKLDQLLRNN